MHCKTISLLILCWVCHTLSKQFQQVYFYTTDIKNDISRGDAMTIWSGMDRGSGFAPDEFLMRILNNKTNGYFVDLAANHPVIGSNTYSLETHFGWNGLCIEANPEYVWGLSRRKCTTVYAVVGNTSGQDVAFRFAKRGAYGGIVGNEFKQKEEGTLAYDRLYARKKRSARQLGRIEGPIQRFKTVTLETIFKDFDVPRTIDFLSFDVEGAEEFIIAKFPFHDYTFLTLAIEGPSRRLHELFHHHGYIFVRQISPASAPDIMYIHRSIQNCQYILDTFQVNRITRPRYSYVLGTPQKCI